MLATLISITPIFLVIALGLALRKGGIPSTDFWNLNDKLVYWVLLPCLMFNKISLAPLGAISLGAYSISIIGGFLAAVIFGLLVARAFGYAPQQGTSILQGCARHNSFIGLALAENLYGAAGFDIAILATAILVPVTNVMVVVLIVSALREGPAKGLYRAMARELLRNPHIISILLALLANQLIGREIPVIHDVTGILGAGALPIMLLAVGANLHIKQMQASTWPLLLSFAGKMVIFPMAAVLIGLAVGLPVEIFPILLVYTIVPTGVSSYTLAKQLGGDAPLMAAIVTLQTLIAMLTIPLSLWLVLPLIT